MGTLNRGEMKIFPHDIPLAHHLRPRLFLVFIMILATVIYALSLNGFLEIADDNAHFIILAQSLASGKGYIFTADPTDHPDLQYPPLFPMILAPVEYLAPGNQVALKCVSLFFLVLAIWPLYILLRRNAGEEWARAITFLWAISPSVVVFAHTIMVEALYCAVSFFTLSLLEKEQDGELRGPSQWILLILSLTAAFYTRLLGVALLLTALFVIAIRRPLRQACGFGLILGLIVVPWLVRGAMLGMGYADEFRYYTPDASSIADWIGANLFHLLDRDLPDLMFYPIFTPISAGSKLWVMKLMFGAGLAALLILGFVRRLRVSGGSGGFWPCLRSVRPLEIYVLIYMGMCMGWNRFFPRHYMPLLAFFWLYLFLGIDHVQGKIAPRLSSIRLQRASTVLFVAAVLAAGAGSAREIYKRRTDFQIPSISNLVSAAHWVRDNVSKEELVISRRWRWMYVMTGGIRGIGLWDPGNPEHDLALIRSSGARYLLLDDTPPFYDTGRGRWNRLLSQYQAHFQLVFSTPSRYPSVVYRIQGL